MICGAGLRAVLWPDILLELPGFLIVAPVTAQAFRWGSAVRPRDLASLCCEGSSILVERDLDFRLAAESCHQGDPSGCRERENSAASMAAAPSKQRPAGFRTDVRHSGFAALSPSHVDCSRVKVDVLPI